MLDSAPSPRFRVFRVRTHESAAPEVLEVGNGHEAPAVAEAMSEALDADAVLVVRPGTILHHDLRAEIGDAITDPGLDAIPWLALASDGLDIDGRRWDSGNYLDDPADPAPRPLRLAASMRPALLLASTPALSATDVVAAPGHADAVLDRILGADAPVYLTHRLRFSAERPTHDPSGLSATPASQHPDRWRRRPTVTVVVRTAGDRPELLHRSLTALAREFAEVGASGDEVLIVSTAPSDDLRALIAGTGTGEEAPFRGVSAAPGNGPGRTETILAAVEAATTDYVWFIDDDDWIEPGAVERATTAVHAHDRPLVIGSVTSYAEGGGTAPDTRQRIRTYLPGEWYRAFTGWNHLPNCALVYPRSTLAERLSTGLLHHDLGEDYALQLLAVTAPDTTVLPIDGPIANVSIRDDTSVSMTDRTPWLREIGSHLSRLQRDPTVASTALWHLGRAARELPYPAPVDERTDDGSDVAAEPMTSRPRRAWWRRGR